YFFVHPKQEPDFTGADPNIARRHVGVWTNMAAKLGHKRMAKPHHLIVRLALWVKIGTSLAPAHGQGGQTIFENLFECQELQYAGVHGWVKPEASFVGTYGRVHLNAVSTVHMDLAFIVNPCHPERDQPLRFYHSQ